MESEKEKDYPRLIAAQNESARRLKIKGIINTLSEEQKKKTGYSIASGVFMIGTLVAIHFSGIDSKTAIETEVRALNSFDALKQYLAMFTPATYASMIATVLSISKYIKHKKNYSHANQEFYDMMDNQPEDYQDIVEGQAKSK